MNKFAYRSLTAGTIISSILCSCGNAEEKTNVKFNLIHTSKEYKHYDKDGSGNLVIMTTPGHTMSATSMDPVVEVFAENQKPFYKKIYSITKQADRTTTEAINVQVNKKKSELADLQNHDTFDSLLEEGFEVLNIASSQGAQVSFDLVPHLETIFGGASIHTLSINGCVRGGEILNTFKVVESNPMVQQFGLKLGDFSTNHNGVSDLFPAACSTRYNNLKPNNTNLYFIGSTVEKPFDFITRCGGGISLSLLEMPMIQMFVPSVKNVVNFYTTKESDGLFTLNEQVLEHFPNTTVKGYVHDAIYTDKTYMSISAEKYTEMRLNASSKELENKLSGMKLN